VALLLVIWLSAYIYQIRDQANSLAKYGYPGIFLISVLANGTVLLPAPGVLIVFAMGAVFNPIGVAFAAGTGAAIGELTGYIAGFSGQGVLEQNEKYEKMVKWLQRNRRWSSLIIFIFATIPNPFFDIAGIAAGSLRIPIRQFIFWCWLGKIVKMLFFAIAGAKSINLFL
jgi:membrane protein YqaA with SNARE-associated domain